MTNYDIEILLCILRLNKIMQLTALRLSFLTDNKFHFTGTRNLVNL